MRAFDVHLRAKSGYRHARIDTRTPHANPERRRFEKEKGLREVIAQPLLIGAGKFLRTSGLPSARPSGRS
jgi:hypothetical protein